MANVKKLKKFMVYVDDGSACYKVPVPAYTKKDAENYLRGNGEIIKTIEVTDEYLGEGSLDQVYAALNDAGFGEIERDLIIRALDFTGICKSW